MNNVAAQGNSRHERPTRDLNFTGNPPHHRPRQPPSWVNKGKANDATTQACQTEVPHPLPRSADTLTSH